MSLKNLQEAIESVAEAMIEESKLESITATTLRSFARELRTAIKASGTDNGVAVSGIIAPQFQHEQMIEKAREEFRGKNKDKLQAEEGLAERMVEMIVGPDAPATLVGIPGDMPVGAKTMIGDRVFVLKEEMVGNQKAQRLHYSEVDTKQVKGIDKKI